MKRSILVCCVLALFFGAGGAGARVPAKHPAPEKTGATALAEAIDHAVANYESNMSLKAAEAKREQLRAAAAAEQAAREQAKAAAAAARAAKRARRTRARSAAGQGKVEAEALAKAIERVVAHYKRSLGLGSDKGIETAARGVERLTCFTGVRDRHARIGVQLVDGRVNYFAYYSKWKPRTCSIAVERNGPDARWEDNGTTSKVTLNEGKGILLINRRRGSYRFVFQGVDRMRYCGMDGEINGSLTVVRGNRKCIIQGVMDGHQG